MEPSDSKRTSASSLDSLNCIFDVQVKVYFILHLKTQIIENTRK